VAISPILTGVLVLAIGLLPGSLQASQDRHTIGNFSAGDLSPWKEKVFKGHTLYTLKTTENGTVLHADSQGTASAFYNDIRIDLDKTPCLNWSWQIDHALDGLVETTKSGDDFAARIYVVVSGGLAFWNTRALNYVWSGSQPVGSSWPNAFTEKSFNVVVQSGPNKTGQWVHYSRNVRADFLSIMGQEFHSIDGIAIMTDTDNSSRSATANFGDIHFSSSCS